MCVCVYVCVCILFSTPQQKESMAIMQAHFSPPHAEKCTLIELDPNCVGCTFDSDGNEMCICEEDTELNAEGKCEGTL